MVVFGYNPFYICYYYFFRLSFFHPSIFFIPP